MCPTSPTDSIGSFICCAPCFSRFRFGFVFLRKIIEKDCHRYRQEDPRVRKIVILEK